MNKIFETISECRICCSTNLNEVLNLGNQPPANSLYEPTDRPPPSVPLRLLFCSNCSTVQIGESVDPEYLFSKYIWVTGTSSTANKYSYEFSERALEKIGITAPKVLEVASNDGTFLKPFKKKACNVLGVDPAQNLAEIANKNGIKTINEFFNIKSATNIISKYGFYDIVFARNVLPHVKDIHSVVRGLSEVLSEKGLGIIEFHDAGLIMEELQYDSIYHEHLFLFSLQTISRLFLNYNLHIYDVDKSPISGGSWVVYFSKEKKAISHTLKKAMDYENKKGVNSLESWINYGSKVHEHAKFLNDLIRKNSGELVAYGASARSSTLLNFCGIDNKTIKYIIDKNPLKNGKITPGSNIPIKSLDSCSEKLRTEPLILLLAWNFQDEIISEIRNSGFEGKFIIPLPNSPRIL